MLQESHEHVGKDSHFTASRVNAARRHFTLKFVRETVYSTATRDQSMIIVPATFICTLPHIRQSIFSDGSTGLDRTTSSLKCNSVMTLV